MTEPSVAARDPDPRASRRFSVVVLAIVVLGLGLTATAQIVSDPMHVLGTGQVPSILTGERDEKPDLFLRQVPPAQALIVGSSRVMKLRPACLAELTGSPAFNFGLSDSVIEDMTAVLGFVHAQDRSPLRELVVGLDIEGFTEKPVDIRMLTAPQLRQYLPDSPGRSWATVTQALFGWQGFRYAMKSLQYAVRPASRPAPQVATAPDGLIHYLAWEPAIANHTFSLATELGPNVPRFATAFAYRDFAKLSTRRLALLRALFKREKALGVTVRVIVPPIHRALEAARADGPVAARERELDGVLRGMAAEGLIQYLPITTAADFGGDPDGYYDGMHLTEENATRMLLALYGRSHGCGL